MRAFFLTALLLLLSSAIAWARPVALELWLEAERAELPKAIQLDFSSMTVTAINVIGSVVSNDPNKVVFYVIYRGEKSIWREVTCLALEEGGYLCTHAPYPPLSSSGRVVGQ